MNGILISFLFEEFIMSICLKNTQRQSLQLRAINYCFVQGGLGWRNPDGIILHCVDSDESKDILHDLHVGVCSGHFSARTTAHKVM